MSEEDSDILFAGIRAFEWSAEKFRTNLRLHGFSFRDARWVIDGPTIIRRSDRKGETRYMVFGFSKEVEVVVICTIRGDRCRIISARKARRDERKRYHSRIPRRSSEG